MTELQSLISTAREDFSKQRVNKAVEGLITILELLIDQQIKPPENMLIEPAPISKKSVLNESVPAKTRVKKKTAIDEG